MPCGDATIRTWRSSRRKPLARTWPGPHSRHLAVRRPLRVGLKGRHRVRHPSVHPRRTPRGQRDRRGHRLGVRGTSGARSCPLSQAGAPTPCSTQQQARRSTLHRPDLRTMSARTLCRWSSCGGARRPHLGLAEAAPTSFVGGRDLQRAHAAARDTGAAGTAAIALDVPSLGRDDASDVAQQSSPFAPGYALPGVRSAHRQGIPTQAAASGWAKRGSRERCAPTDRPPPSCSPATGGVAARCSAWPRPWPSTRPARAAGWRRRERPGSGHRTPGGPHRGGQLPRAASAILWSSSRPTPLAACTAMPNARVVT